MPSDWGLVLAVVVMIVVLLVLASRPGGADER